jgi:hypothetical protein
MNSWRTARVALLAVVLAVQHASASMAPGAPAAAALGGGGASVSPYMPGVTGTASTYAGLNINDLQTATLGACDFLEGAFEETFTGPLNVSRWDPSQMSGLDHCTGLAPAGAGPCTAMLPSMVILNANFTTYNPALTGSGLVLRASQAPCSALKYNARDGPASQCCAGSTCAAWAGAHLVSQGCILYGVLELEAAFDLTKRSAATNLTSGAFYFTATYIVKSGNSSFDPSWNEIDIGMIEGPRGTEFHATIFTAAPGTPTATTMDALTFDPLGPVVASGGNVKSTDGSSAGSAVPGSVHAAGYTNPNAKYNSSNVFHTYKVVWTPNWIAWMVDLSVYRNITFSIWRPQSIRQILRTNVGDAADPAPAVSTNAWPPCTGINDPRFRQPGAAGCVLYGVDRPDAYVYIKRIRYTPLSAQAISDALTSTSMFAKYGLLPTLAQPTSTATSTATYALGSSATSGSGRHLLQAPPTPATVSAQLSALVPGTTPGAVSVSLTSYAIGGYVVVADSTGFLSPSTWTAGVQSAFLNGLDGDLVPDVTHITVQSVQPLLQTMQCDTVASTSLPACPLQGAFANSWINVPGLANVAGGVVVEFTVGGYSSATSAANDLASLNRDSGNGFATTVYRLSAAESTLLSTYLAAAQAANDVSNTSSALLSSQDFSSAGPANVFMALLDTNSAAMYAPQVYAVYTVQIVTEATSSSAVFSGLNSGLSTGLTGTSLSTYPPSRTQAIAEESCSASTIAMKKAWYGVGIAFVIAFGIQTIVMCVLIAKVCKAKPAAAAVPAKSVDDDMSAAA